MALLCAVWRSRAMRQYGICAARAALLCVPCCSTVCSGGLLRGRLLFDYAGTPLAGCLVVWRGRHLLGCQETAVKLSGATHGRCCHSRPDRPRLCKVTMLQLVGSMTCCMHNQTEAAHHPWLFSAGGHPVGRV